MRRFDHYAQAQRWIWEKARALADRHDLGEPIDVIVDALDLYERRLREGEEEEDAPADVPDD